MGKSLQKLCMIKKRVMFRSETFFSQVILMLPFCNRRIILVNESVDINTTWDHEDLGLQSGECAASAHWCSHGEKTWPLLVSVMCYFTWSEKSTLCTWVTLMRKIKLRNQPIYVITLRHKFRLIKRVRLEVYNRTGNCSTKLIHLQGSLLCNPTLSQL